MRESVSQVIQQIVAPSPIVYAPRERNKCATCQHALAAAAVIPEHVVACPVLTALRAREVYDAVPADVEVLRGTGFPDVRGDVASSDRPRGSRHVQDMVVLPRATGACIIELDSVKARAALARFARSSWQFGAANEWIKTADRLPTTLPIVQVKVLFTAPAWAVAHPGMYQHNVEPNERWSQYSSDDDRYYFFEGPTPTLWVPLPELPSLTDAQRVLEDAQ